MGKRRDITPHPTDPSIAIVTLTKGQFATISAVDSLAVGRSNWSCSHRGRYASARINNELVLLHRFVAELAGVDMSSEIDHINGNGLDCRRMNLRMANRSQNTRNVATRSDNTTGFKGVYLNKRSGTWFARVSIDNKPVHVGSFNTQEEAVAARNTAALETYGEFARERISS